MKYLISAVITLAFLVLDWLALHDIINGEEDLVMEYGILVVSLLVYLALVYLLFIKKPGKIPERY
ncbi:MAG: hypothetical protein LWX07_10700 [Bacteroidetes bacterium]|nr:hypothetical protein [Bacteroidota bacterium]